MKNEKYLCTDNNKHDNNIAWFEINGETWGRDEKGNVVDCDGCTVDYNDEYSFVPKYRAV